MNSEMELAARIQKVIEAFGRQAEKQRALLRGVVKPCKGCGADVTSHGQGRPKEWCEECRRPGGPFDVMTREYKRKWAAKMYQLAKQAKGGK